MSFMEGLSLKVKSPQCVSSRLYLIADTQVENLVSKVEEALAAGITAVRLRDHHSTVRETLSLARKLRDATDRVGAAFFVTDRLDLMWTTTADGIHVPEEGAPVKTLRPHIPHRLIGKSVHTLEGAVQAEKDGADFITYSPIFETPSKKGILEPRGLNALRDVCEVISIPVFALGGMTPERAKLALEAGAYGVALIRAVLEAPSIRDAVSEFRSILGEL